MKLCASCYAPFHADEDWKTLCLACFKLIKAAMTTSDFPELLSNTANKSLATRKAVTFWRSDIPAWVAAMVRE